MHAATRPTMRRIPMYPTMQHLDDEHMRLYEWSGAGAGITLQGTPARSIRTHALHASYGLLALLTLLLALNGCDSKGPVEQAGEQVNQAIKDMQQADARSRQMNTMLTRLQAGASARQASPDDTQPGSSMPKQ